AGGPLLAATELAMRLEARPLLRELVELAHRARINLPDEASTLVARDGIGGPRGAGGTDSAAAVTVAVGSGGGQAKIDVVDGGGPDSHTNGRSDLVRAV